MAGASVVAPGEGASAAHMAKETSSFRLIPSAGLAFHRLRAASGRLRAVTRGRRQGSPSSTPSRVHGASLCRTQLACLT